MREVIFNSKAWEECFNKDSPYYYKLVDLILSVNRDCKKENGYEIHHIIPRSYFKAYNLKVDNSDDNLIKFRPSEHYLAHFYMSKCANSIIKRSMTYAIHLMTQTATLRNCDFSAEEFAIFYEEVKNDFSKCQKINTNLRRLTQEQRHQNFIKAMKSRSENMDYRKYLSDRMKGNKLGEGRLRYSLEEINLMTLMHNIGYTLQEIRQHFLISSQYLRQQVEAAKKKWGADKVIEIEKTNTQEQRVTRFIYDKYTDNVLTLSEVLQKENISDYVFRKNLEKEDYRYCLTETKSIADIIDYLLPYYKQDKNIIDRLRKILDLMVKYNED